MKRIFLFTLISCSSLFMLNSCKKEDNKNNSNNVEDNSIANDIYVNGRFLNNIWVLKNGNEVDFDIQGDEAINQIKLYNGDIYAVGVKIVQINQFSIRAAALWKNKQLIWHDSTNYSSEANNFIINGDNVYITGIERTPESDAVCWVNGKKYFLPKSSTRLSAEGTGIGITGNDVYVCGNEWDENGNNNAMVWKNYTTHIKIHNPSSTANSMALKGNDVYVAGHEYNNGNLEARLWKNGDVVSLESGSGAKATAVAVNNNNVFVTGNILDNNNSQAVYWTNGKISYLDKKITTNNTHVNNIALLGNVVYAVGFESSSQTTYGAVNVWRNSKIVKVYDNPVSAPNSIAVR